MFEEGFYKTTEASQSFLNKMGLPGRDLYELPSSSLRFPDGGQYRFEVPGIQRPSAMRTLLGRAEELGLTLHRITQTIGIMRLTDGEIEEMADIAKEFSVILIMAVGPRATYDTSATALSPEGGRIGYRLRGGDQLLRAIEDVKRGVAFGVKGILIYDEGLLYVLGRMKEEGLLPKELELKVSAHCGHGNPASAKLIELLGATSINPVRDLQLPMLAAIRGAIKIPIDVHTENPKSSGGFIRHYEVPEMVRICSPIYLKTGGSVAETHGWETTKEEAGKRAVQVSLVRQMIERYYPEAKPSH
jgi:hypothetical protein